MMKFLKVLILCFLCSSQLLAKPLKSDFVDWTASPEEVLSSLKSEGIEAKLKSFHKTGVPTVRAKVPTLGNIWETTIYFDERNRPNQVLLQLDEMTRSGVTRVQKLAVGDYGEDYEVKHSDGKTRKDTFFTWQKPGRSIVLNTADYKKSNTSTIWLKIRPSR